MLEIGSLVDGKYKILNKIGQGGMSIVYLAMNEKANKQWAVKEVRKDGIRDFEVVKQGLMVETEMLKRLSHPSLPSIVDVIEEEDTFLIVMDYIQGNPLSRKLEESGPQPQERVIAWAKQLCDVLGYLHTRKPAIIYRDMKPANVMLKPDGDVMLIDFGTAREFKEKNVADTTCLGTVGYAAPEQFGGMGQTDARTDIYSLGATLYHLVTGQNPCKPPYEIKPIRGINPSLSQGLEQILLKCTSRNPKERYQSAAELMYDLEHYDELDDLYRRKRRNKMGVFLASAGMTVILGAVSAWGHVSAEKKKSSDYDQILKRAADANDYYEAILTDPTRTEAYEQLNGYLTRDFELSREEAQQLLRLWTGLEQKERKGFQEQVDVLEALKKRNPQGYEQVCYGIGESFLFYYDVDTDCDRYGNAARWFREGINQYPIAGIYCDISDCLTMINQFHGTKIKQTDRLYEEYGNLWKLMQELKGKADHVANMDSQLQVWREINDMISAKAAYFLGVVPAGQLKELLAEIRRDTAALDKVFLQDEIQKLQQDICETIAKLESAEGRNGG